MEATAKQIIEYTKEYVTNHPEIIYKGIPLAVAAYMISPLLLVGWTYLPWIWASYEIYNRLPEDFLKKSLEIVKKT